MSLTVAQVYSVRFGTKLPLPGMVQDSIAKLRITAPLYRPVRPPKHHSHSSKHHHNHKHETPAFSENWRVKSLVGYVSRIKDNSDPDYNTVFGILNKVSPSNFDILSKEAMDVILRRDQEFRLRVSTLLFNKAISESMFASVMADFAVKLYVANPEVREDLVLQASMFPKLYDINTTLTCPLTTDTDYQNKLVLWAKQKDKRRGYAKFLTQLFIRDLITEELMISSIENVMTELKSIAKQPRTDQTDQNTAQFVDFLFETANLLSSRDCTVRTILKSSISEVLAIPRDEIPSFSKRSQFRMEDALKCVQ